MSHLGSRVAPLVDGQLPAAEAEELLAHAAACARCHWLLGQERASRTMLSQAWDVEPGPELTARLLALRPGPEERAPRGRRVLLAAAGAGGLAAACAVGLVVVGSLSEPRTDPHAILDVVSGNVGERPEELADASGEVSGDVVAWMSEQGWSAPESLPSGMRVVDVAVHETEDGEVLEVEIAGAMAHVRVLQQRGVLAGEAADQLQTELVGQRDALLLRSGVHDLALQSEGCVVVVLAAPDDASVSDAILAALPDGEYDTSVGARFVRGWDTVTGWALG
ncbi:Putative zinc-finger [Georgenia satyanarayanai]|uniref:Zinc-finger n=1 Tax=Georgenia satyanarayanai TaxID=860221 RepID=A0A2Y9A6S0_9MICO|nr:zf-HC2 domain-containing protein [Georgenia satyanarayanai]PYG00576.1 putative zinc finger protein [Georgenia satyanarayanai]SSA39965.1 Putative zinc-finger [Georgenia satyanarayanai]